MDNFNLKKSIFNATDWAWHDIQDRSEFNAERVDLSASVTTIDISQIVTGFRKFAGGILAPNGNIYFIPYNIDRPYVIHTRKGTLNTYFGTTISGSTRYEGGVLAPNGKIYCSPGTNNNILVISPAPTTNTNFGLATLLSPYLNKF